MRCDYDNCIATKRVIQALLFDLGMINLHKNLVSSFNNFIQNLIRRQEEVSRAAAAAEARRQEAEREERERRRHESELAAMRERHLRERLAHVSQTAHGQKMLQKLDEEVQLCHISN